MPQIRESLLRTVDRTAELVGLSPHLNVDAILKEALFESGRTTFSRTQFVEPLRRLVAAYEGEADLSTFGRLAARFDILRALRNLLRFDQEEEVNPDITLRTIARPVFIMGLPRSGTTFLHMLMACDPNNIVPRAWQLIYPYPERDPKVSLQRVERQFWIFRHLSPGLEGMHPVFANAPQECTDITAQVFQSLRFDTTHRIPSYQSWIDSYGHLEAFRFHKRFLQHLDAQAPGHRWILKCPDHLFTLDAILSVYPDAFIVILHRDPLNVLASVAKLTDILRRPFTRYVDRIAIGREVSERWVEGANRMVNLKREGRHNILHLQYNELISDPLKTLHKVYDHCGIALGSEVGEAIISYIDTHPRGGYHEHKYSLSEYGLDAGQLRLRFARYTDEFGFVPGNRVISMPSQDAA